MYFGMIKIRVLLISIYNKESLNWLQLFPPGRQPAGSGVLKQSESESESK
jgi:hypothetical protein